MLSVFKWKIFHLRKGEAGGGAGLGGGTYSSFMQT